MYMEKRLLLAVNTRRGPKIPKSMSGAVEPSALGEVEVGGFGVMYKSQNITNLPVLSPPLCTLPSTKVSM